jgi:hypothetical protein
MLSIKLIGKNINSKMFIRKNSKLLSSNLLLVLFLMVFSLFSHAQEWQQKGSDIDGEAGADLSGGTLKLSADGNTLAIGAYNNNGNGLKSGHVRVFNWNGTSWVQKGNDIDGEAAGDRSGISIDLSADGNILAVGADYNSGNGLKSGHVRIYHWNNTAWIQRGSDIDGEYADDIAGGSVSLSADGIVVAIGAIGNDVNGSVSGHGRVFSWNGSSWIQKGNDIDGLVANDACGETICLNSNGNIVAIGSPYHNEGVGQTRVFHWNGSNWVLRGLAIDGENKMDFSSTAISLCSNGNIIAIGSPNNKNGSLLRAGMVRVYEWDGSSWIQRGKDLKGNKELDLFGNSVCLDQDGNTLVIGADDLNVSNGGRGYVDVYSWNAIEWIHKGSTILGEQEFDQAGFVSINADGNVIAIGSEDNDGTGDHAGHVRVFSINWVGLEEENDFSGINVFPNPANQDIQIDFDDNLSLVGMKVIDINGKMIYSNAYSNIKSINYKLEGESGIYFLELTNKEGKLARFKVIKE